MFGRWKKKRGRYYREKLRQYEAISEEYKLGLKWEEYQPIAWKYAEDRAKSERGFLSTLFSGGNIFKTLFSIVMLGVSVIAAPFATAPALAYLMVGSAIIVTAQTLYSFHLIDKMLGLALSAIRISSATSALKGLLGAQQAKDKLTHFMLFNAYDIYADGSIYSAQNAGSQSYSNSQAPDPNKGLLGQYAKIEIDEKIHNRSQTTQSGNLEYTSELLGLNIPLKVADLPLEAMQDSLENNMRKANTRIAEGFYKLNELYFNYLGTAQGIYERVLKEQIEPYENKMIQNDF